MLRIHRVVAFLTDEEDPWTVGRCRHLRLVALSAEHRVPSLADVAQANAILISVQKVYAAVRQVISAIPLELVFPTSILRIISYDRHEVGTSTCVIGNSRGSGPLWP